MAESKDQPNNQEFVTGALARFIELGGLVSRVGISVVGNQTVNLLRSAERAAEESARVWRKTALLTAGRLGRMKGAAMKMGQMLSLYEGMLPPEFTQILESLQKDAPPVPFEKLDERIRAELGAAYDRFESIDSVAFASASIGQVHRARLVDGRAVVVKIQYPGIDEVIRADLKNLKILLKSLFGMFTKVDLEPHWQELKARLLEELDYRLEAENLARMAELHADNPDVILPAPLPELSSQGVLTLTFEPGLSAAEACAADVDQSLRDRWGRVLFELVCKNVFEHRYVNADPNLGNFAFREDGRVVLYDFGCMKAVPDFLVRAYAGIGRALLDDAPDRMPALLDSMEVRRHSGRALDREITDIIFATVAAPFRADAYTFGSDSMFAAILDVKQKYWSQAMDMEVPPDLIFMDRTFAGTYGNLCRLRARGDFRTLLDRYVSAFEGREREAAPA